MESQERVQHEEKELWEAIFSRRNLFKALERVKGNKGSAGLDGMSVEELPEHLKQHWEGIHAKLDKGSYVPSPVWHAPLMSIAQCATARDHLGLY